MKSASRLQAEEASLRDLMDPRAKIIWFVPHHPQRFEDASAFGMFTPGVRASSELFLFAARMPGDVREIFADPADILHFRLRRFLSRHVQPIDITVLASALSMYKVPAICKIVLTEDPAIAEEVDKMLTLGELPVLHVSSVPGARRFDASKFSLEKLREYCVDSIRKLQSMIPESREYCEALLSAIPTKTRWLQKKSPLKSASHNVTLPNESTLRAFGYSLSGIDPIVSKSNPPTNSRRYIAKILSSAAAVSRERRKLMANLPESLVDDAYVLTASSFHWRHRANYRKTMEELGSSNSEPGMAKLAFKTAVRQQTYFDQIETDNVKDVMSSALYRSVLAERSKDVRCYTSALALFASQRFTPIIRLEPKINDVLAESKMLGHSVRMQGRHRYRQKQSRLLRALSNRLRALIDNDFQKIVDELAGANSIQGLKIISDAPLEMMNVLGCPLALRFDVSKIPVMPGNLLIGHCIVPTIHVTIKQLSDILVLRSFRNDDPIRNILYDAVMQITKGETADRVRIRFVDVDSEDDVVNALNDHSGSIVIFDGHGGYDDRFGVGTIVVGGIPVEVWNLRGRCRFPPIVIFSACDTHPIDGSHGSCANAAFALGAISVLATSLPVDGHLAAFFIARLILRIAEFVPILVRDREVANWREVISGMLRMAYVSDVLSALTRDHVVSIDRVARARIQMVANNAINYRCADWHEQVVNALAREAGMTVEKTATILGVNVAMVDAVKYIQLGSPENIVIIPDESHE